ESWAAMLLATSRPSKYDIGGTVLFPSFFFFLNDTPPPEIYPLSLHAALPILDIGGGSASTGRPPVAVEEEIERVAPLIERVTGELGALVSVDTYKPAAARAAIAAGARIVNDVSGLRDEGLAEACASSGAALVLMHTRAAPRERLQDPDLYDDVTGEVLAFLGERIEIALAR